MHSLALEPAPAPRASLLKATDGAQIQPAVIPPVDAAFPARIHAPALTYIRTTHPARIMTTTTSTHVLPVVQDASLALSSALSSG